jgi:hypothetical protein
MIARIYRPGRGATQSGNGRTKSWILEYERMVAREIEPLMGWTSSNETVSQVKLAFASKEEAVAFVEKLGIQYRLEEPKPDAVRRGLSYSDNFKTTRMGLWTH